MFKSLTPTNQINRLKFLLPGAGPYMGNETSQPHPVSISFRKGNRNRQKRRFPNRLLNELVRGFLE
jgi:hypothetical protein